MPLSSQEQYSFSENADIKEILVTLYKLLRAGRRSSTDSEYQYNYTYIPDLAMTGAPPLPVLKIALPIEELPPPKWVFLVAHKLAVILVNNSLSNVLSSFSSRLSFSVDNADESEISSINGKAQALEDMEQEIQEADSQQDLEQAAFKLASLIRDITEQLAAADSSSVSFDIGEMSESEIEMQIRQIDEQLEVHELNNQAEEVSFSVPSGPENPSSDRLISAFKEIVKSNAKLAELEKNQSLISEEVDFSPKTSAAALSFEKYNKLFSRLPLPKISSRFQEDLIFAYMRVAGPNPVMLEQVSDGDKFLQTIKEQFKNGEYQQIIQASDSLEAALKEGRLYKADYSMLQGMKNGSFPSSVQKYVCAPSALFAVPPASSSSRSLVPVAIQCSQPSAAENPPVFTPLSGDNWMVAKSIVQMADSNYHELVSHLGRTHLVIEPFAIATKRKLPANHKLRILLAPHLEGTILINYGAHKMLIADNGKVDAILASTIDDDRKFSIQGAKEYLHHFNDIAFPKTLESRHVNDTNKLPEYPYRDDGLLVWEAIHTWVSSYLKTYYLKDEQVEKDPALQNWAKELVSDEGGRLQNFGEDALGTIKTLDYLIDTVSTVIFTASAQHAAVNFPQNELMSYAPAFPLAIYAPAPTSLAQTEDLMSVLPPLEQAKTQIGVLYLLGSVYYTQLGKYQNGHFQDEKVKLALGVFQKKLTEIEAEIKERNYSRPMPYEFLLPSKIPQSINI